MSTTKRDKTRQQKATSAPEVTAAQLAAVDALMAGATDAEAAQAAGVVRATVNAWKRHNPAFIAALNARREELWASSRERLRALLPAALDRVEAEIADPDSPGGLRAAMRVIETGLSGEGDQPEHHGPTEAEAVLDDHAKKRRGPAAEEALDAMLRGDAGPVTDDERREALDAARESGAFE